MTRGIVISLYDFTGEALKPWAEAGYTCWAFDIQHDIKPLREDHGEGCIMYMQMDLHQPKSMRRLYDWFKVHKDSLTFGMAFPVCTDVAVSGAAHFKRQAERQPEFQTKAVNYAKWCARLFNSLHVHYFVENHVNDLATKWRNPYSRFHPYA